MREITEQTLEDGLLKTKTQIESTKLSYCDTKATEQQTLAKEGIPIKYIKIFTQAVEELLLRPGFRVHLQLFHAPIGHLQVYEPWTITRLLQNSWSPID